MPVFIAALPPLALPGILLGIIFSGIATPTEAAAIAAALRFSFLPLSHIVRSRPRSYAVTAETVRQTAAIGLIISGAFAFNYVVANEGVPVMIRNTLIGWQLSPTAFLLSVNLLLLLLAVVLDEITILLVIVPLLTPVAQSLHGPGDFGVIIMLNMMIGLALPPHGLLLFVISNLTGTSLAAISPGRRSSLSRCSSC